MTFEKVNMVLSSVAFILYIVGVSSPYWMSAELQMPIPPPDGFPVEDHMGLFINCKELHFERRTDSKCDTEGASDWQFIAAAMAIVALFLGLVATVFNFVHACVKRCLENHKLVVGTALLCIGATGFMTSTLIMYAINHRFQLDPNLHIKEVLDHDWSFFLCAAGACLYAILILTNFLDGISLAEKVVMEDAELNLKKQGLKSSTKSVAPESG